MYGFSVLSCMSSGLSEPGGAGLGTLGMSEAKVREIATTAGFSQVPPPPDRPPHERLLRDPPLTDVAALGDGMRCGRFGAAKSAVALGGR